MAPTLYVETNFAIGIAKGQDAHAIALIERADRPFRLVWPAVCFMEALKVREREVKDRTKFIDELESQAREMGRDTTSEHSIAMAAHLERAVAAAGGALEDFVNRLEVVLDRLAREADLIDLDSACLLKSFEAGLVEGPADALILQCVLEHAGRMPIGPKAFLSGNSVDFDTDEVKAALQAVGVKYFRGCDSAVGWLTAQASPPRSPTQPPGE